MCTLFNRASVSALLLLLAVGGLHGRPAHAQPLTTAFIYQGELQMAGLPASGPHDLRFRLYDAAAGGLQIGTTLCSDNVALAAARFTVSLDFGAAFAGQQRFLEIEARADTGLNCLNPAGFVILGPRQPLTAAPNAAFALTAATATTAITATSAITATNAAQLNGQAAAFYQNAANLSAGALSDLRLSTNVALLNNAQTFTGAKTLNNAANLFTGTFTGTGTGLTGLNASNISSGTIIDLRLSSNVALLSSNQLFTGVKNFSTAPAFTAAGSPFSVSATGVVTNLNADLFDGLNSTAFLQSIPVPLTLSGSSATQIIRGTNSSTASGASGVFGESTAASGNNYGVLGRNSSVTGFGVRGEVTSGTGATFGVYGISDSTDGHGVRGFVSASTGTNYGVSGHSISTAGVGVDGVAAAATGLTYGGRFESNSTDGRGVYGDATATSGVTYGGRFESNSTSGRGVLGNATSASGLTYGVYGLNASTSGRGVYGEATSGSGITYGVYGLNSSTSGRGVYGEALAVIGQTYGVYGLSDSTGGRGVYGYAAGTGAASSPNGVRGFCSTATLGFAVFASGDMGASGVKPFRIDHPFDPENKYLLHYSSESPFPQNFYNGNITTDADGFAWVELPEYFAEINTNFKYQLTVIGKSFAQAIVSEEISENRFQIQTNQPNVKVSWEVKADRNDLRIKANRPTDEREKTGLEKGKYQHPEYYNLPKEMGMDYDAERESRAAVADRPVSPK